MNSIKVLPESVRNSLRSGIILSDLTRVVEELVFNCLDAGATKVIVAIGVGTNYIKVTDNGCGITRDGLVLLGERYATSKFEHLAGMKTVPETFGFRGEALSSISDVSLLQVVTKAHGMPNGYCKVIKCSKCLYLGIDDDRQDVGTTVVVRDLFYNQPVRRRHLQSSPKKVLHSVKECILRIALVHLGTCFKVIDIESGDELLSLYPSSSPMPLLVSSFGTEVSSSLQKLDASDDKLKLSGFISSPCETFYVKAFQYFYINSRYISRGPIHKLLNQLATDSNLLRSECGKRARCQTCLTYILNLTCPRAYYDLSFEPTKTCAEFKDWDPVFTFIKKTVSCFWSRDARMPKEDDIWDGANTITTKDDPLNDCILPKKRRMTQSHQTSIVLSSPQLKIPKHMPYTKYSCNPSQRKAVKSNHYETGMEFPDNLPKFSPGKHMDHLSDTKWNPNNKLVVKEPFHFDYEAENIDGDIMKPFLRSCSSHMDLSPVVRSKTGDDQFKFQSDDGFKKWCQCHLDDRADNMIQGCETWLEENTTLWSPPRIISTYNLGVDSPFISKGSFDSVLSDRKSFTENISPWASPVASNQRSQSSKFNWSPFERSDVVSKRDDWFDDTFDFGNMRYSYSQEGHFGNSQNETILFPQQSDFLYETDWTSSESHGKHETHSNTFEDKQPRRSQSAPPSYRGKKKFVSLNSLMTDKSHNQTLHIRNAPLQEANNLKHVQKSPGVHHLNDLQSKARHNKKKIIDKAEISDHEGEVVRCLDVYNTDLDFISMENQSALDVGGKWRSGCPWDSGIKKKADDVMYQDSILDISSGILHLSGDSLTPKSITKKCLQDSKVLQQVDKKFIPIVGGGILAIIDQHAADERIRLEDLRKKVLSGKMKTINYLDAEQELVLPEIGYQLLNNYYEQIQKWGWICNFHESSVSFKKNLNFLHNQPSVATLIAVPRILGVNLTDVDLLEFLNQLADTDGSSLMPPAVLRVLNSKACRGAIMFGDALLPSECSLIVQELKQTSLCFQCAHGRPTTVPLVDLVLLHKQIAKLGNWNRGSSGSWHGLSRHRPSLERATQRLGQC
ncbi:hypothetical protein L2E82_34103 [Cichorium intybus]|uniref:Uncharacterized protein n=1 Tax=Cichorium intybus TaxID=13427 RepID=A0ACB9BLP0_CICIN|nr:hypothetical protein L2E82_34103 [Cichorium intybus]